MRFALEDNLSGGTKRRVVRRVECTGAGYARIEESITRRGSRPLNKQGSYRTADGTIVYPRDGYYYTRNPDGSLTKGQGTYQEGVPCPDCLKITPATPEGIDFDPIDWTVEFDPAVPIDIEMSVPEMPPPEMSDPVPDWDMGWAVRDSEGCDSFDPYFTAEEVAYRNERFLRVWTAAGLMGDDETLKFPTLTTEEYSTIRQRIIDGGTTDYRLFQRQWPSEVRWGKRGEIDIDSQCVDPIDPGEISYIFCLPMNDPDVTGGDGQARSYGSLIIEIRYEVPNLYLNGQLGWSYVIGQSHRYNVAEDVVEPCDPWTLLEDEAPTETDTDDTPDLTSGTGPEVPTEGPIDTPTDTTPPVTLDLPECIRQQNGGFVYCPPTTCRIAPQNVTVMPPMVATTPTYEYRAQDGGMMWALTSDVAASYGATHVWVPSPTFEQRPYGSSDEAAWSLVSDIAKVPRRFIQGILDEFPQVNDPVLNEQRAYWERLLATAPLSDVLPSDAVSMMLADLGILDVTGGVLTSAGETTNTTTPSAPDDIEQTGPEVCYEARVAIDGPYPRWYANIFGRWIEIESCCPKEDCCNATKQELSEIKSMISNLTEIVLRREAGEQTPVVDLSNIERDLAEIRSRLDAQAPTTQYDDSRILQRIAELESVVRETRTPAYDDTAVRMGITEIKNLVNTRCEKCQPGTNYDTRFDELEAMVRTLIERPIVTGNGDTTVIDTTPYYLDLQQRIDALQSSVNNVNQIDHSPILNEIRTLIQNLRFATGTEYTENFRRLEQLIANINVGGGTTSGGTDYSSRFNEIMERLEVIRQSTTKNYDGQLAMLLSIVQDLQSRTPVNYDDRFATLEALVRNIKVTEAANYESRFDRLETIIASLRSSYPDYGPRFLEILNAIASLRQSGTTTNETSSGSTSTTTGTTNCGGTTVNCGGTNDIRLDLILERLAEVRAQSGTSTAPSAPTNTGEIVTAITRYVESMKADLLRNDDIRYDEVRRQLEEIKTSLRQSQTQSTTVNTTAAPTPTTDSRIDEVLRLLSTLQSTTGAMSSTLASLTNELAVTQRNQEAMVSTFESYLTTLRSDIRTEGATATDYQTLKRIEEEYAYQRQAYETAIASLQSRLSNIQQTTTQQTSGGARMVERHERIIYDYPQQSTAPAAEECYDESDCP